MAVVAISDSILTDIADAIREQLDTEDAYKPSEMADAIGEIGSATLGTKTITSNGTYDAEDDSLDGYSEVTVNVSGGGITPTGTKQISITENGTTTEDVTNYASAEITVNVPTGGITPTGTKYITYLGTVNVAGYEYIKNGKIPVNGSDWSLSESVMAYTHCLLMKISTNYYLLLSNAPLFIYVDGTNYYEAGANDFKRSQGSNNAFTTAGGLTISETIGTFDGVTYGILGNPRTLSQFMWANHDIKQWGTDTVLLHGE